MILNDNLQNFQYNKLQLKIQLWTDIAIIFVFILKQINKYIIQELFNELFLYISNI